MEEERMTMDSPSQSMVSKDKSVELEVIQSQTQMETSKKPEPQKTKRKLGDPYKTKASGVYLLRVVEVEQSEDKYSYRLEDAQGHRYKAQSKHFFPIPKLVYCRVQVVMTSCGLQATVTSIGKRGKAHKKNRSQSQKKNDEWLPTPAVGEHFHIIYTPMGNKR